MTDYTDDDFFDDATEEFPSKRDLKDRLVAIFAIGPVGQRQAKSGNKPYTYVETVTVVLDNGPDGTVYTRIVPEVGADPIVLPGLQWSPGGMVARLKPRVGTQLELKPLVGRINSKPNKNPDFSPSWSIAEPTDADKAVVRAAKVSLLKVRDDIVAAREKADDLEPEFA